MNVVRLREPCDRRRLALPLPTARGGLEVELQAASGSWRVMLLDASGPAKLISVPAELDVSGDRRTPRG
jgi:hypothetical protein